MAKATEPPKCKICGKAHFGLCPGIGDAGKAASAIVDALLPPARKGKPMPEAFKAKSKLQVVEGSPSEKLAKAREIMAEIENKPTKRKAKKPKAKEESVVLGKSGAAMGRDAYSLGEIEVTAEQLAAMKADPPKPARKGNRHKPGYMAEYMRKRREAAKKGKPE